VKKTALILLAVFLFSTLPLASGAPLKGYYKKYSVTIEVDNDRSMRIHEQITYHNPSGTVKLTLSKTIPNENVENINISDSQGSLDYEVSQTDASTTISFETRWISGGSDYVYNIEYVVPNSVSGTGVEYRAYYWGNTFNVRCENFTLTMQGPPETYPFLSTPEAELVSLDPPTWRYSASYEKGENFGGFRGRFYEHPAYYLVTLNYSMTGQGETENPTLDIIVLNSENRWQFSSVVSSSLACSGSYFDDDNNLHLLFEADDLSLGEYESIVIQLLYEVDVYDPQLKSSDVGDLEDIPNSLSPYLASDNQWWMSDHSLIIGAAQQVVDNETNVYDAAEKITEYVVDLIDYETQDERQGSLWTYTSKRGDCSEYTDLTIALARAAGIPARAAYGWGYYENENLRGHAWVEFYFPNQGWQPADPTWAETAGDYFAKLDPIHLARSIRGIKSSESWMSLTYYGTAPSYTESWDIQSIPKTTVTQYYLSAAQYHLMLASELLEDVENSDLEAELQAATTEASAAQMASSLTEIIAHSKNSILHSNQIILALGEPPTYGGKGLKISELVLIGLTAGCVAGAIGVVVSRRTKRFNFH